MAEGDEMVVNCYSCGTSLNITSAPPYSQVKCPDCDSLNRVKDTFGKYQAFKRHAIGGMSTVLVANDETLGRKVAIKILSEEYSNDETRVTAFKNEAKLTASLSHPGIVKVYTTAWAYERFYIAMEFIDGSHLEGRIQKEKRISEAEVLPIAIQVVEGLKGAKWAGLIHRDIKPANILIDSQGNAKIVDFGLALFTKAGKATAEEVWATPYYVPPESVEGGVEDFRADMYAFGATFYHALSGVPPCTETEMSARVLKQAKQNVTPLDNKMPGLTLETCQTIDRAMAYDPRDRFSSYDELLLALKNALHVVNGRKAGIVRKSHKQVRYERKLFWRKVSFIFSMILAALGTLIVTYLFIKFL